MGPTIDSYALLLQKDFDHLRFGYDPDFTLMPTYIAEIASKKKDQYAQEFIKILLSDSVQAQLAKSSFSKHTLGDDELYSAAIPNITLSVVMAREQLVNKIFDMAVTKRLPILKDSWLSITTIESQLVTPKQHRKLELIKQKLFSVPFSEEQVAQLSQKIVESSAKTVLEQNQIEVLMAEFDHSLVLALAESMSEVEMLLKELKVEANL